VATEAWSWPLQPQPLCILSSSVLTASQWPWTTLCGPATSSVPSLQEENVCGYISACGQGFSLDCDALRRMDVSVAKSATRGIGKMCCKAQRNGCRADQIWKRRGLSADAEKKPGLAELNNPNWHKLHGEWLQSTGSAEGIMKNYPD
jgi:hypothetical protein